MNKAYQPFKKDFRSLKMIGVGIAVVSMVFTSCNNVPESPGWEYMPDMYRSSSYETNGHSPVFADSMVNRQLAAGTITQGAIANSEYSAIKRPYPYLNDSAGYENAGHFLKNPFPASDEVIAFGKDRYEKFCIHCHGSAGKGDGSVVEKGNFPPPPAFDSPQLKNLPVGKMFHTLQYGKGMMGSHASQLSREERWKLLRYVQTLQGNTQSSLSEVAVVSDSVIAEPAVTTAPAQMIQTNDSTDNK